MKEQEEKYKKYLEKAKNVINKMETQNGDASSPQLEAMRVSYKVCVTRLLTRVVNTITDVA